MDAIIQQTISGYTGVFAAFTISNEKQKKEVESFIIEINSLGESCSDVMDFMTKFPSSGLQQKYSDLIASIASPAPSANDTEESKGLSESKLPSVKEFLEQYRPAYQAVLGAGYRLRAQKAYENIFAVAQRTEDLLEMNIILEKERLLWKIVTEDMLDIYEPILAATDPLNAGVVKQFEKLIHICTSVESEEELSFKTDIAAQENQKFNYCFMSRMIASITLTNAIMGYSLCKDKFRSWINPQTDLLTLIAQRQAARRTYELFKNGFGWDFDCFVNDEWMKLWLLVPVTLDTNMRIKQVLDPQNIDAMRELLFEEILSDKSIDYLLLHEQQHVYYFALDKRADEVTKRYQAEADRLNSHLVYFKYQNQLQSIAHSKGLNLQENTDKQPAY